MPEIEVKLLGIDPDVVVSRLDELGATCLFSGLVKCVHFDFEDRPLKKAKSLFRLRRWEAEEGFPSKFEICFKGPKQVVDGCKVREEIETTVEDADQFETMMKKLGYQITMDNEKTRRSYEWEGLHFDIDHYPQVPAYMEIEGKDRAAIDRGISVLKLEEFEGFEMSAETANQLFKRLWPEVDFNWLKF
ncbi:MAG: class IV adenylate cyclase [Candidatus Peregrinibacteria bacterium]|nr:class IV adenylate cyclase [Candidatus Peregrinibacteria bacterium]